MSLRKFGDYNNFPANFSMPEKLKPKQVATYRLLNSETDPVTKKPRYAATKIPSKDRIERNGMVVEIGLIKKTDKDGNPEDFDYIWVTDKFGYITFTGGNIKEEAMYTYLELSNFNESNTYRDQSIQPIVRRIDEVKDAKNTRGKTSDLLEALKHATQMDLRTAKQFAAARGWDEHVDEDLLRARIEDFAKSTPAEYIKFIDNKDDIIKATIKRASDKGIITFDIPRTRWTWTAGNELIATVPKVEGVTPLQLLSDWIKTGGKQSDAAYARMQKELKPVPDEVLA